MLDRGHTPVLDRGHTPAIDFKCWIGVTLPLLTLRKCQYILDRVYLMIEKNGTIKQEGIYGKTF